MSIIMRGQLHAQETRDPHNADRLDPDLRALFDHIAVELAGEYVRLMDIAAGADGPTTQEARPTTDEENDKR